MARTLLCEVVTPERVIFNDEVEMAVVPTIDGEVGILPLHAPLVGALKAGEVRLKIGDTTLWFAVSGGYIQVHEDKVIILADNALPAADIDVAGARETLGIVRARLADLTPSADGFDALQHDLQWAEAQVKVGAEAR